MTCEDTPHFFRYVRIIGGAVLMAAPGLAATRFGGFYEFKVSAAERSDLPWNVFTPQFYFNPKLTATPAPNTELYAELAANSASGEGPRVWLNQAQGYYRLSHWETTLFLRRENHWVDSPLLGLVDVNKAADDRDFQRHAQGARVSIGNLLPAWSGKGLSLHVIGSKYKTFDGEAYIGKLRHNWVTVPSRGLALDTGGILLRKQGPDWHNTVYGADARIQYAEMQATAEAAWSEDRSTITGRSFGPGADARAWRAELRDIRVIPMTRLVGAVYESGPYFHDFLSRRFDLEGREFDRRGAAGEAYFLVPGKAVTLAYKRDEYTSAYNEFVNDFETFFSTRVRSRWQWGEVHVKYRGGLQSRVGYEHLENRRGAFPSLFMELIGERPEVYARVQAKLKHRGMAPAPPELGERWILGGEVRMNLTERVSVLTRRVQALTTSRTWGASFVQVKYYVGWPLEVSLEYGLGSHTEALVNASDVAENRFTYDGLEHPYEGTRAFVQLVAKTNF